jgi:hypothetical protein
MYKNIVKEILFLQMRTQNLHSEVGKAADLQAEGCELELGT